MSERAQAHEPCHEPDCKPCEAAAKGPRELTPEELRQHREEMKKHTERRKVAERAAKKGKVIFQRIAGSLYINHAMGFTISRDLVWNKGDRPRWTATWKGFSVYGVLRSPATQEYRCDSMAEARRWCERFAKTLVQS